MRQGRFRPRSNITPSVCSSRSASAGFVKTSARCLWTPGLVYASPRLGNAAGSIEQATGFSSQGLNFDNRGAVITARPERDGARRIVHKHSPDVRGPGKEVFAGLTRPWIHPQHAVVRHRSSPHVTVLVHDDIVRRAPWSGRQPLLEALGTRVEHANAIDTVLTKPEAVVGVHPGPARPRVRCRGLVEGDRPGLRVDPSDLALFEIREIRIVPRVGHDIVDVVRLALLVGALERLERLDRARRPMRPQENRVSEGSR